MSTSYHNIGCALVFPTYSIAAISAASRPRCFASFITRVYPPSRNWYRGPNTCITFVCVSLVYKILFTIRRPCSLSLFFAFVMSLSASIFSSLAFATVVTIRSCSTNEVSRLRIIALLCLRLEPNLRILTLFFMVDWLAVLWSQWKRWRRQQQTTACGLSRGESHCQTTADGNISRQGWKLRVIQSVIRTWRLAILRYRDRNFPLWSFLRCCIDITPVPYRDSAICSR